MITRKLVAQKQSTTVVIPPTLMDLVGMKPGDVVSIGIDKGKVIISPVRSSCKDNVQAAEPNQINEGVQHEPNCFKST